MCRKTLTKPIAVGYSQLNSTTFRFFALGMHNTDYLNMQHLGAGHIFFILIRIFGRFQQSCTLGASLPIYVNSIGSLRQRLY